MRTVTLRGQDFYVHDSEDISNAIVRDNDYYEDHILDFVLAKFPVQSTIVDAGAMIGNHTNYFARFFQHTKIVSFEPILENFRLLELNSKQFPTVSIYNKALSNYNGTLRMSRHNSNWGMHSASELYEDRQEEVPCMTLDSLDLQNVTLLKIDVEYYEPVVLEGATETIARNKPTILIEDVHQRYMLLPQLKNYSLSVSWPKDFTYLYVYDGE